MKVNTNRVVLPASCTLRDAVGVKAMLMQGLDVPGNVEVDARSVEVVDASLLQLLVAFTRDMRDAGRAVTWKGASGVLSRSAEVLGLVQVLGLDAVIDASNCKAIS
jgi:anti-anti-sigma regulatory factor